MPGPPDINVDELLAAMAERMTCPNCGCRGLRVRPDEDENGTEVQYICPDCEQQFVDLPPVKGTTSRLRRYLRFLVARGKTIVVTGSLDEWVTCANAVLHLGQSVTLVANALLIYNEEGQVTHLYEVIGYNAQSRSVETIPVWDNVDGLRDGISPAIFEWVSGAPGRTREAWEREFMTEAPRAESRSRGESLEV